MENPEWTQLNAYTPRLCAYCGHKIQVGDFTYWYSDSPYCSRYCRGDLND